MTRIDLFYRLISVLESHTIPYAIVGRTEEYPNSIGSDIDIVIPRNKIDTFHHAIWDFEDKNTMIVQMIQHEIVAFYYVIFHFNNQERVFIQPDVCTDYYRKGRKLLSADYLLENRKIADQGGFYVLSSEKEFLYYLLKKIDKRNLSIQQFEHIRNSYLRNKEKALIAAKHFWDDDKLAIIEKSLDEDDYHYMRNNLHLLQNAIHSSHRRTMTDTLKNCSLKLSRTLTPTGFIMSVMGPDGSGKTTVINHLEKDIEPAFRRIQQFHLFPIPLTKGNEAEQNPQGEKTRGFILSLLKLLYLLFIYTKGHFQHVLPSKIRSTLTIYDRYYDDLLIDPKRYRNGTPAWVVKAIRLFINEPELWIILDCPTSVIQARKAEVPMEETERQRNAYLDLSLSKSNCLLLNTNRDIREITYDACKFMCEQLNERAIKRYKK